jgi:hypothetical protein
VTGYFGLVELVLVFGIIFGIGFWQLRSINRSIAEDKAKADAKKD